MARPRQFPPRVYHANGRDRIHWRGRFYTLGPTGSPEARRRYLDLVQQIERFGDVPAADPAALSVAELCVWWVRQLPRVYRPASREPADHKLLAKRLGAEFGPLPVAEFTPKRLREFVAGMAAAGWSRKVINRRLTRVKTMLRHAAEDELITGDQYHALTAVKGLAVGAPGVRESVPRQAADPAAVAAVIARVPAPVAALLAVAQLSGMRPGEARLMRAGQVQRRNGTLLYRRTPEDGHKGAWLGRTREIHIGPQAARVLSPWLYAAAEDGGYVFRPSDAPRTAGRSTVGECYTDMTLPQAVRRAALAAGVTLTAYQLRHLAKQAAVEAGGVAAAMSFLGQTSSTAFDGYAKTGSPRLAEELARKIG